MVFKGAVFDMDGLLLDTERLCVKAWDFAGRIMGKGKLGYMVYETLGITGEDTARVFRERFGEKFNFMLMKKLGRLYFRVVMRFRGVPLKEGAKELLSFLSEKGIRLALATSTRRSIAVRELKQAGLYGYFASFVVCGDMVARSKPAPDIYLEACRRLELEPSECAAFEDSPNGIRAAASAGLSAVMVPDLTEPDEELCALLYTRLNSLFEGVALFE